VKVWLVKSGEPLPTGGPAVRLFKTGLLAKALAGRGHEITWWTTSFDHFSKRHVPELLSADRVAVAERYEIVPIHAIGYRKNVSLRRILSHYHAAFLLFRAFIGADPPDIVVASFPTPEMALVSVLYGRVRGVPVLIDVRDLWPDVFVDMFPRFFRGLARLLFFPIALTARIALSRASAITGNTEEYVDWGVRSARRARREVDQVFPMSYMTEEPTFERIQNANAFWDGMGVLSFADPKAFNICFAGSITNHFDLITVIRAAGMLREKYPEIKFVLCGVGALLESCREAASANPNVLFPGWVEFPELWALLRRSALGLAPYKNTSNFTLNIPNKPVEYLSAGVPLLSCTNGPLRHLIETSGCGTSYKEGDPEALCSAIERFYTNRRELAFARERASEAYQQRFDSVRITNRIEQLMERLVRISGK
jgi:glycosyltransferase involved in cell wall biosynthesis